LSTKLTTDQIQKLAEAMEPKGVAPERFQQILSSGVLGDLFEPGADLNNREAVRQALKLGPLVGTGAPGTENPAEGFRIVVDYAMTFEQMVAAGQYDWKNDDIIAKQFPVTGEGRLECEARLFNFEHPTSSEDAEKAIRLTAPAGEWEPGKLEHLLAFGAKYPEEQRKIPIVCLGSVSTNKVFGKRQVAYLYRRIIGRSLHLDWYANIWHPFYRFLGIRKMPAKTAAV
jgi:hypothetical protein